ARDHSAPPTRLRKTPVSKTVRDPEDENSESTASEVADFRHFSGYISILRNPNQQPAGGLRRQQKPSERWLRCVPESFVAFCLASVSAFRRLHKRHSSRAADSMPAWVEATTRWISERKTSTPSARRKYFRTGKWSRPGLRLDRGLSKCPPNCISHLQFR